MQSRQGLNRNHRFAAIFALTISWTGAAIRADEEVTPPAAPAGVLHLAPSGSFVGGRLVPGADARAVHWQSPHFVSPFEFAWGAVNAIHFDTPADAPQPQGAYCVELAGGDILYGALTGLDSDAVVVRSPRLGQLRIARQAVQRLYRWRDTADLIYQGPNGLAGWRASPAAAWREEAGQLLTDVNRAALYGDLKLPPQAAIELEISWEKQPDFVLGLGVNDDDQSFARAFRCEVWLDEIVVVRETDDEADVVLIGNAQTGPGRLRLQVYLDQLRGRCLVCSPTGEQLADLRIADKNPQPLPGIRLLNKRSALRLERLRISRWNGAPPQPVAASQARIHHVDGSTLYGAVTAFDPKTARFTLRTDAGEQQLPADRVASVFLSPPGEPVKRLVRAVYHDGTQLSGNPVGITAGRLHLKVPGIAEPLDLPLDGLRSLIALDPGGVPAGPVARKGVLELEGLRLWGGLAPANSDEQATCLNWQPLTGGAPCRLRPGVTGRIVYREPPESELMPSADQRQAHLVGVKRAVTTETDPLEQPEPELPARSLHLRTGDTVRCDVLRIDERGVTLATVLRDEAFVPHEQVAAVELADDGPNPIALRQSKRERLLTLPRMQKANPPTHLIRSKNGDYLRGRLLSLDAETLRVEVRLETKEIPRDRLSRIIWLHPEGLADDGSPAPVISEPGDVRVQGVRGDNTRLTLVPTEFANGVLSGRSVVLGPCRLTIQEIDQLLIGGMIDQQAARLAYQQFKLRHAQEPSFAQAGDGSPGGDSALVGKPAADFELDLLAGGRFRLSESRGRVVVLDFWASWCGPCLQALPQVAQVAHDFADRNVRVVAVNIEEGPEAVRAMLERHQLQLNVALDRDGAIAGRYGVSSLPQTIVIDQSGQVARHYFGASAKLGEELSRALEELLGPQADVARPDAGEK